MMWTSSPTAFKLNLRSKLALIFNFQLSIFNLKKRGQTMNIIITAGGTIEPIDTVRGITNFATGRLGSLLAERLANETGRHIIYVHGKNAALPKHPAIEDHPIGSAQDLKEKLHALCGSRPIDMIIHSMAVSDYTVASVTAPNGSVLKDDKISSSHEELILHLRKTPKIIADLRQLAPNALLIGFKLLSGTTKEELITRAQELLLQNKCDYVIANALEEISGDTHRAYLVDAAGIKATYQTKKEIAEGVAELCQKASCWE
jgi:phosphopantothenate-cysteine ligase